MCQNTSNRKYARRTAIFLLRYHSVMKANIINVQGAQECCKRRFKSFEIGVHGPNLEVRVIPGFECAKEKVYVLLSVDTSEKVD